MAKVRIRLDCTIEVPGHGIPRGLPERVVDFVEGGLRAVGLPEGDDEGDILPGARMRVELVLPRKGGRKRQVP